MILVFIFYFWLYFCMFLVESPIYLATATDNIHIFQPIGPMILVSSSPPVAHVLLHGFRSIHSHTFRSSTWVMATPQPPSLPFPPLLISGLHCHILPPNSRDHSSTNQPLTASHPCRWYNPSCRLPLFLAGDLCTGPFFLLCPLIQRYTTLRRIRGKNYE